MGVWGPSWKPSLSLAPSGSLHFTRYHEYKGFTYKISMWRANTLSEKVEKIRVSVTMTRPYLDALDSLVEEGIYLGRGEAILDALRIFLRGHGIEPFCLETEEPVK